MDVWGCPMIDHANPGALLITTNSNVVGAASMWDSHSFLIRSYTRTGGAVQAFDTFLWASLAESCVVVSDEY